MRSDLLVLTGLVGLTIIYAIDWYSASSHIFNTIMVLPLTVIILIACGLQFVVTLRGNAPSTSAEPITGQLPIIVAFTIYVLSLNYLGFDVGTFLFIAASLWLHGERRLIWIFGYALAFASIGAIFFSNMLPYDMPLLVLGVVP